MMTALTTSLNNSTSDDYVSQTDEAELIRLQKLSAGQGLGDSIYDDGPDEDMVGFLQEMGMGIERKE